jgi:ribosome modulation factor
MHKLVIPGKYRFTDALQRRYVDGWQAGLNGQTHPYPPGKAANAFKREFGAAQLNAYNAGYQAGVISRQEYGSEPGKPPAKQ